MCAIFWFLNPYYPMVIVIDGKIVVVRSHNYSFTALAAKREITVILKLRDLVDNLRTIPFDWGYLLSLL
jgi:hypothetical protein